MTFHSAPGALEERVPRWPRSDANPPTGSPDEIDRLRVLRRTRLLDRPGEERFDRITRLTRRLLDSEAAYLALVDADRLWFISTCGLDLLEVPRAGTFAAQVIAGDELVVSEDARTDVRFRTDPAVAGPAGMRFLAGVPLIVHGRRIGVLCAADTRRRSITAEERNVLFDLAAIAENEIGALSLATQDPLTGLMNRAGLEAAGARALALADRNESPVTALFIDIDRLKWVNDHLGHEAGDRLIRDLARILEHSVRMSDVVARIGGDEFFVLLESTDQPAEVLRRAREAIDERNGHTRGEPLSASFGVAVRHPHSGMTLSRLMAEADLDMYRSRRGR